MFVNTECLYIYKKYKYRKTCKIYTMCKKIQNKHILLERNISN